MNYGVADPAWQDSMMTAPAQEVHFWPCQCPPAPVPCAVLESEQWVLADIADDISAVQERARKVLSETVDSVSAKVQEGVNRAMALTDQDLAEAAEEVTLRQDEDLYPCWAALMRLNQLQGQLAVSHAKLEEPLHALLLVSSTGTSGQGLILLPKSFDDKALPRDG